MNDRIRESNEPEFREITGKEGHEGCQQCNIYPRTSLFSSRPHNIGKEKQLTNPSKIAIHRPENHDRGDAVQTDHTENKNATRGGRYYH